MTAAKIYQQKTANYCELTGIYWAWKNLDADYIGLVHYRRYISNKTSKLAAMLCQDKQRAILLQKRSQDAWSMQM